MENFYGSFHFKKGDERMKNLKKEEKKRDRRRKNREQLKK